MKYNPDLIPEKYKPKIEIDKYLGQEKKINKQKSNLTALFYIIAGFFGILFLANIFTRFYAGIFFLSIGLIILPSIHNLIEKILIFSFNWKIKTGFISILLIPAFLFTASYKVEEDKIAEQERIATEIKIKKEKAEKEEQERIEKQRIDSLNYFVHRTDSLKNKKKYKAAILGYENALKFCKPKEENELKFKQAQTLFLARKYDDAIKKYTNFIDNRIFTSESYYERALCFHKKRKIQKAVFDLNKAIELGNNKAHEFHEKINPLRKRIISYSAYYICCDGTKNYGYVKRGSCSHHGGVCRTGKEPNYENYRKYKENE